MRYESEQTDETVIAVTEPVAEVAQNTQVAKRDLPAVVDTASEQEETAEARDNNGMPRRSRRSPRHLRVSGQRRRRYRDERYPTQSAMPLAVACASPEMASGKVWIRYPVARPQEQQSEELNVVSPVETETAEQPTIAPISAPEAAVVVEAEAVQTVAAEQPAVEAVDVETTHPEVIAAPVDEQPQVIAEEDTAVAQHIVEEAQAAAPVETVTAEPVETVTAEPVVEAESTPAETPAPEEVVPVTDAAVDAPQAPVVTPEPEVKPEPVAVVTTRNRTATAPMTRAPAPEYQPEAPRHSSWVRPTFDFDGKGAAGGHSATHQATAPATRPNPVE